MSSTIINNIDNITEYTYLELGVFDNSNFNQIKCKQKQSVDVNGNATFTGTTDEFFNTLQADAKYDIIFIDANHDLEFVVRDYNNAIKHTNRWLLIHDMIPPSREYTQSSLCSDSYKLLYYLLTSTDNEVYPMDSNFGLTFVKMPASEIDIDNIDATLDYDLFMSYLQQSKLYNYSEIVTILNDHQEVKLKQPLDYSCYLITNEPSKHDAIQQSIVPETVHLYDGTGYPSFSKLVNDCVEQCPTETVIIMSDRVLPDAGHVQKVLRLLEMGYAFVGLYRFAFFGFKKELFRRIGPLDETFVGGGGEDIDWCFRLREANLACYLTHEVPYTPGVTRWQYGDPEKRLIPKKMVEAKWDYQQNRSGMPRNTHVPVRRRWAEPEHDHDWGPAKPVEFLKFEHTYHNAPETYVPLCFPQPKRNLSNI